MDENSQYLRKYELAVRQNHRYLVTEHWGYSWELNSISITPIQSYLIYLIYLISPQKEPQNNGETDRGACDPTRRVQTNVTNGNRGIRQRLIESNREPRNLIEKIRLIPFRVLRSAKGTSYKNFLVRLVYTLRVGRFAPDLIFYSV